MKTKLLPVLMSVIVLITGCTSSTNVNSSTTKSDHEPLTMMTFAYNFENFEKALHEVYPEVNLEFVSYNGSNSTEYGYTLLKAGEITDIFATGMPPTDTSLQVNNLYDLSGEEFISSIRTSLLRDVTVDGAVYMIPTNVNFYGPYYNKTLFDKMGWEVPTSIEELEELIPKIQEAGLNVCETQTQFAGSSFSYFFDTIAPDYLTTLEGQQWIKEFLAGETSAEGNLDDSMELFEHLINIGLFHIGDTPGSDADTQARFKEGNTAFLITNTGCSTSEDDENEYVIMPYLSKDGTNNTTVTKVNTYYGINKDLEDNPEKLEDAIKVMSFIASEEGQNSLSASANTLSPLKSETLSEDDGLYEVAKLVDKGQSMTLLYSGWESYLADVGANALKLMQGEMSGSEFLKQLDSIQQDIIAEGGSKKLADVEEDLDKTQVANLVGAAYATATEADCALISIGDYHGYGLENRNGVNGNIYASVKLDSNIVSTFNPLGWTNTIKLVTLTGKQIKEWQQEGYYNDGDDTPFEYLLVTKDGSELEDETTYTVAISSESEERSEEGNMEDSGIVGQDAIIEYVTSLKTINSNTIIWK